MDQNENQPLFGLSIEGQTASTMNSTVQWGRVLGICGIILGVMLVLLGIIIQVQISRSFSRYSESNEDMRGSIALGAGIGTAMFMIMGAMAIIGNIFLINYANRINTALKTNDTNMLNSGFVGLRNYLAFWAVVMIILILIMIIRLVTF